ncbi:hypothetical protein OIO90_000222 [Microbotryomycetes sp. JL221]|nr:hypothetical protein OIO90_000222 [Microbotryomycetes sp. JL221]
MDDQSPKAEESQEEQSSDDVLRHRGGCLDCGDSAAPQPGQPAPAGQQGGDALDKGVNTIANKLGKPQSRGTVEKISDGFRKVFKKATGKDVPIQDK